MIIYEQFIYIYLIILNFIFLLKKTMLKMIL